MGERVNHENSKINSLQKLPTRIETERWYNNRLVKVKYVHVIIINLLSV